MKSLLLILFLGLFFGGMAWGKRAYQLFENKLPWTEAQSYCRAHHLDLATVADEKQMDLLINATQRSPPLGPVWTGLYDDVNSWKWSLQKEGFYDGGLDQFRFWNNGEPNNYNNSFTCGVMLHDVIGKWKTGSCRAMRPFMCYSANATQKFILVNSLKNWFGAQAYCRQHYTDLASIRNQAENDQMFAMLDSYYIHIGLYRDSLKWSDSSPVSFLRFNNAVTSGLPCVAMNGVGMEDKTCSTPYPFVCNVKSSSQQVVKVKVTNDGSLNLEAVTESMLEQLKIILRKNGLDVELTWRKRSDGNVFHREERNTLVSN